MFYGGHGLTIGDPDFMVPSDATELFSSSEALIQLESLSHDSVLEQISNTVVRLAALIR